MLRLRSRIGIVITCALAAAIGTASADPGKPNRGRPHQTVPTGGDDAPGAPVTDAAAEAELEAMTSQSSAGLTPVVRYDGSLEVDLEGRFMDVMVAGPGGRPTCLDTHSAVTAVRGKKAVRTAKLRRGKRVAPPAPTAPVVVPAAPSLLEVM